jgi:hypothetical protein
MTTSVNIYSNVAAVRDAYRLFPNRITHELTMTLAQAMQRARTYILRVALTKPATGGGRLRVPGRKNVFRPGGKSGAPFPPYVLSRLTGRLIASIQTYTGLRGGIPTGIVGTNAREGVVWEKRRRNTVISVAGHSRNQLFRSGGRYKQVRNAEGQRVGRRWMPTFVAKPVWVDPYTWINRYERRFLWPTLLHFQQQTMRELAAATKRAHRTTGGPALPYGMGITG